MNYFQRKQDKLEIEALEQETRSYYLELLKKKKKLEMELQIEELSPDPQYLGLKRQQKILSEQLKKVSVHFLNNNVMLEVSPCALEFPFLLSHFT